MRYVHVELRIGVVDALLHMPVPARRPYFDIRRRAQE